MRDACITAEVGQATGSGMPLFGQGFPSHGFLQPLNHSDVGDAPGFSLREDGRGQRREGHGAAVGAEGHARGGGDGRQAGTGAIG